MDTDAVDIAELLDVCVEAVERAGVVIRHVRESGELHAVEKHANDPVTRADFAAQTLLFGALRARWPRLALVGEEDEARRDVRACAVRTPPSARARRSRCRPRCAPRCTRCPRASCACTSTRSTARASTRAAARSP